MQSVRTREEVRGSIVGEEQGDVLGPGGQPPDLQWTGPRDAKSYPSGTVLLVSNNRYLLGLMPGSGTRPRIDEGELGIAVVESRPDSRWRRLLPRRPWRQWSAPDFEVRSGNAVPAGIDGEATVLTAPLRFRTRPAVLRGWGRTTMVIAPNGEALPCQAAATIPGLEFANVKDHSLEWIWNESAAFTHFRGTDWMPEPCKSCDQREIDWGGCRCQAMALTGSAAEADPACGLSPFHAKLRGMAEAASHAAAPDFQYRRITPRTDSSERMRSHTREPIIG